MYKNINVTGTLFKKVTYENRVKKFEMPFDTIVAKISNSIAYIKDFFIVLNFCLNGIKQNGKLYVLLRLSKVSKDIFTDLVEFILDFDEADYVTFRRVFSISRINLNDTAGLGEYVFKVLVKTKGEDNWNVQSYIPLRIE